MNVFFPRVCALIAIALLAPAATFAGGPYLGNGIKSGEPTQDTVIVWTRLTDRPDVSSEGVPWPMIAPERDGDNWVFPGPVLPEGHSIEEMEWALPGAPGEVRLNYWPESAGNMSQTTDWMPVNPAADFTHHFTLSGLAPGTKYRCVAEARAPGSSETADRIQASFKTAPAVAESPGVTFTVVTGQEFWRRDDELNGHKIYPVMAGLDPDFFVHTGDIEYHDKPRPWAVTKEQARYKWNRIFAMPYQRAFHNEVTSYFLRDDHDTWQNDCWPTQQNNKMGDFTYAEGVALFYEQIPGPDPAKPWRTVRWGKDVQIWLVEGRDFRSPNDAPDGPDKTIWGAEQLAWFKKTVEGSDATFRVLISPTPVVGPDREAKADNHANKAFAHEGQLLREFMASQKNMVVICGDRHWQYVTVDPETGLREYSSGPTSDVHAGGFRQELREPMHQYLNIIGGFFACTVERRGGEPTMILRHYDVAGNVVNEDVQTPASLAAR